MKAIHQFLWLLALAVWPLVGRAQTTYTSRVIEAGHNYLSSKNLGEETVVQTFSGFSDITAVSWAVTNWGWGNPKAAAGTFQTYIAQWDAANGGIVGDLVAFGDAASVSFGDSYATKNLTFTGDWAAPDPSLTYALVFTAVAGGADTYTWAGPSPGGQNADFYGTGALAGFFRTQVQEGGSVEQLESFMADPNNVALYDENIAWWMSVTGTPAMQPVPEPKAAAAGLAALFVVGLVGRRWWRQRQAMAAAAMATPGNSPGA